MATFDFVVDTHPMAESVYSVSHHVSATTAAVVAMEEAVIQTEKEASKKICQNVTNGFHILIKSQVSQKAANYFSQMSSKMILLLEFAKSLGAMQKRMNNDFQRLKREYTQIFSGLDKSLEARIRQLNKRAMELGDVKKSIVTARITKDAPSSMLYEKDTQNAASLLFTARIKSKTSRALENMSKNIFTSQNYKRQLDSVLKEADEKRKTFEYIPVIFTEEKNTAFANSNVNNVYVSENAGPLPKSAIETFVMKNISEYENQKKSDEERAEVKKEFLKLVSNSNLDERATNQILALFNASENFGGGEK